MTVERYPLKWFDGLTMSGHIARPLILSLSKDMSGRLLRH